MSAEDLAIAIEALDEESVRAKVAAGDVAAVGDLNLSDEEQALLQGAADEYPEVVGYAFDGPQLARKTSEMDAPARWGPDTTKYDIAVDYLQSTLR